MDGGGLNVPSGNQQYPSRDQIPIKAAVGLPQQSACPVTSHRAPTETPRNNDSHPASAIRGRHERSHHDTSPDRSGTLGAHDGALFPGTETDFPGECFRTRSFFRIAGHRGPSPFPRRQPDEAISKLDAAVQHAVLDTWQSPVGLSGTETLASFTPTSAQDGPSSPRGHARPESESSLTPPIRRLKSPLHGFVP